MRLRYLIQGCIGGEFMRVAIPFLLGIALIALPGVAEAQSSAPQDSSASEGSGPCIPVLPEPDFSPSAAIRANRERSIKGGAGEVDLPWFLPQEDAARDRAMPMWMQNLQELTGPSAPERKGPPCSRSTASCRAILEWSGSSGQPRPSEGWL